MSMYTYINSIFKWVILFRYYFQKFRMICILIIFNHLITWFTNFHLLFIIYLIKIATVCLFKFFL